MHHPSIYLTCQVCHLLLLLLCSCAKMLCFDCFNSRLHLTLMKQFSAVSDVSREYHSALLSMHRVVQNDARVSSKLQTDSINTEAPSALRHAKLHNSISLRPPPLQPNNLNKFCNAYTPAVSKAASHPFLLSLDHRSHLRRPHLRQSDNTTPVHLLFREPQSR